MAIKLFGFSIGKEEKETSKDELPKKSLSFVAPDQDDGAIPLEVGGYFGTAVDFDGAIKTDLDLIKKYRDMAIHPEVESAIADICNESIVYDDTFTTVKIDTTNIKYGKPIKDKVEAEFEEVLKLMNFSRRGYEIFRKWYVDGRIYYHIIIDEGNKKKGILEIRPIDPTKIRKIRKIHKKPMSQQSPLGVQIVTSVEEFYVYNEQEPGSTALSIEGLKIYPDSICFVHSGLYDGYRKKVIGYLHKAIKALNQLRMIEDAVVIYRITRAPERRVFYVDVGNLPKQKAEEYVRGLMQKYRNKLMYDPQTGEIADSRKHMSMLEDFWMPRREGGRGTEISTLEGGQNLSEMEDVKYFQKKLFQSLNVPTSRLEESTGFNMGRSSEISRDEVKFFKFIERLRMKFSEVFLELLRVQLVLKGVIRDDEWADIEGRLAFKFAKDSHFSEIQENDILKDRLASAREAEDFVGKYYSREWVRKMILRQTEDDVEQIDKQIEEEKAAGLIAAPEGAAPPPEEQQAPPPAPAPAAGGDGQPQVTIGEIVPDDEKEWNS
tara:strand:- start:36110 stop:37753 length:1644 start_codon:yes stop_codon:yes gene_type:complete